MNNTTNTVLIIILVLLVGFGVWYFTASGRGPATDDQGPGIEVDIRGGSDDDGTSDRGPGDN